MKKQRTAEILNLQHNQDWLEVLAVIKGLKPVAVLSIGGTKTTNLEELQSLLKVSALYTHVAAPWLASNELETLPHWYLAEWMERNQMTRWLYVSRDRDAADRLRNLGHSTTFNSKQEAELLGYPLCCVDEHHRRCHELHKLNVQLITDISQGNENKMRRLVRTGVELSPRGPETFERFMQLVRPHFAAFTSIAMCESCRLGVSRDAQRVSQSMQRLADNWQVKFEEQLARNSQQDELANFIAQLNPLHYTSDWP